MFLDQSLLLKLKAAIQLCIRIKKIKKTKTEQLPALEIHLSRNIIDIICIQVNFIQFYIWCLRLDGVMNVHTYTSYYIVLIIEYLCIVLK